MVDRVHLFSKQSSSSLSIASQRYVFAGLFFWIIQSLGIAQPISVSPASRDASSAFPQAAVSPLIQDATDALFKAGDNSANDARQMTKDDWMDGPARWVSPDGLSGSLQILLLLTVLSLAPAILLMTTCYVRIIVVMGLLRQALGTAQLPPSQVITSISLFLTLFVMAPVWNQVYRDAIQPYTQAESSMTMEEAWEKGAKPIRRFMARQIDMAGNHDDVLLFLSRHSPDAKAPKYLDDVPLTVLLPAYMLSELKTAFMMGFQIYLPFLILDIVIASVTISMGMMMLPPAMISMPFKLLLFVLVDGWRLVVDMLLNSFGTYGG
jgi:flagellar biosynthesis protein FliP